MISFDHLEFRIACYPSDFEQIHKLNYLTFVEEIPQHTKNSDQTLVDKFNSENTYFTCLNKNKEP